MSYGRFMGQKIDRADAFELDLVGYCDQCGSEGNTDDMHMRKSGRYCDECIGAIDTEEQDK